MPTQNENLVSIKIARALKAAMFSLLEKHRFRKMTVADICEEALISRATFYAYFTDKYNFLKWWMIAVWPEEIAVRDEVYEVKEQKINQFVNENKTVIKNLFINADSWTLDALFDALYSILQLTTDKTIGGLSNPKYIVLSNFYIGGMIYYIMWQVKNDFPQNVATMNNHLHEVITTFQEWN